MAIDVNLQYRGHNSFYLQPNQRWISNVFAVQNMPYITHSFWAMASRTLTSAVRARTRFYDADGMQLAVLPHQFSLGTLWDFVDLPMAVSAGAHSAQLEFVAGADGFWFAEPKSEEGQTATPYNINYAGHLTKLTPTGIYTGLLHANQIVVTDTQVNPEGRLGERLVTINSTLLSMTADLGEKGRKLTEIEAGQITLSDTLTQKTTRITSDGVYTGLVDADQVKTGRLESQNGQSWLDMDNGRFSFGNGALTWSGSELTITGKFRSRFSAGKPTRVEIDNGKISIVNDKGTIVGEINNNNASVLEGLNINTGVGSKYLSFGHFVSAGGFLVDYYINHGENPHGRTEKHVFIGDGYFNQKLTVEGDIRTPNNLSAAQIRSSSIRDADGREHLSLGNNFTRFYDQSENIRLHILSNGEEIVAPGGQQVFFRSGSTTQIESTGGNKLGVDNGGAYQVKSGVKSYL